MEIQFLGTGTSTGVPQIGCKCKTCTSADSRDKRLRASVLIIEGKSRILIDCGPDLRQQMLSYDIDWISGILITHEHYDHLGGLDDVRPLGQANVYAEKKVLTVIQQNMSYSFREKKYPGVPSIILNEITEDTFFVNDIEVQPIRIMHASLPILGFRIGKVAYLTDVKTIEDKSIELLKDLDILIISSLRHVEHFSHLNLNEALELSAKIGAHETYFTHISHDMGLHEETNRTLPERIQIAHDGLKLIIN
jgi:phosphoribosyl 1,2-cyclic phosphate phosphodiesterase